MYFDRPYFNKLPVSKVTSVCWGGPALSELFVTTARDPRDAPAEPLGGAIFTIRQTGRSGVPAHAFRFDHADLY
ncbi:putative anterior fat body protein [Operophtera brumata]|uniref:Putative anterior fat body protein n=1 Tax=Operophtera brumata TaxID=104452 RepID=A0A0L7LRU0_OPEBR|nr:putative anterior fat body protein [Operophtera brumata]